MGLTNGIPQVTLELLTTGVSTAISPQVAERLTAEECYHQVWGMLIAKLTTQVLGQRTIHDTRTYTVDHPATWWQHLKHAWFPKWYKYRWPVRWDRTYIKVEFKQYETYPKASISVPAQKFGYPVMVDMLTDEITTDFLVRHDGGGTANDREYLDQPELAHRICSVLWKEYVPADGPWSNQPPVSPDQINKILGILGTLGVNPHALVRRKDAL